MSLFLQVLFVPADWFHMRIYKFGVFQVWKHMKRQQRAGQIQSSLILFVLNIHSTVLCSSFRWKKYLFCQVKARGQGWHEHHLQDHCSVMTVRNHWRTKEHEHLMLLHLSAMISENHYISVTLHLSYCKQTWQKESWPVICTATSYHRALNIKLDKQEHSFRTMWGVQLRVYSMQHVHLPLFFAKSLWTAKTSSMIRMPGI